VALSPAQIERVIRKIDPTNRLLRTWNVEGGVSAQVTGIEIEGPDGQTQKLVLRQHGDVDFAGNPNIAADEFRLLEILQAADVPVPQPYLLDTSGDISPRPYLVVAFVEGSTKFAPADVDDLVIQLAENLVGIHAVDGSTHDLSFLPSQDERYARKIAQRPARLDQSIGEGRIRDALEAVWPWPRRNPSVLLHGDYWPGNILWRDGRVAAIVDWEDAAIGDPLYDLANTRLELLWALGVDAMEGFTRRYLSTTSIDCANLPYWELCVALRPAFKIAEWAADDVEEARMRQRHQLLVDRAFEMLPTQRSTE
jgi:aminoglycoside phosphotransferase (APT) family kinase protein